MNPDDDPEDEIDPGPDPPMPATGPLARGIVLCDAFPAVLVAQAPDGNGAYLMTADGELFGCVTDLPHHPALVLAHSIADLRGTLDKLCGVHETHHEHHTTLRHRIAALKRRCQELAERLIGLEARNERLAADGTVADVRIRQLRHAIGRAIGMLREAGTYAVPDPRGPDDPKDHGDPAPPVPAAVLIHRADRARLHQYADVANVRRYLEVVLATTKAPVLPTPPAYDGYG